MRFTLPSQPIGLYVHIPFCAWLCHYCDFAKTARFSDETVQRYFQHLTVSLAELTRDFPALRFRSLYFGGGTPGLFGREYEKFIALASVRLDAGAEVTMEANPNDLTPERLQRWKSFGVNRVSLGVQSFAPEGLKFLTRQHDRDTAIRSIEMAMNTFDSVNVDLIYGWEKQTNDLWHSDLATLLKLQPQHVSLYNLTYENSTPIGKRQQRGLIKQTDDDHLANFYQMGCEQLVHYQQEEVSNWHLEGHGAKHNQGYWRGDYFVGLGCGAHGFLPGESVAGDRYAFSKQLNRFLETPQTWWRNDNIYGGLCEKDRRPTLLADELIASGLRTNLGVEIERVEELLGKKFAPRPSIRQAMNDGLVTRRGNRIFLSSSEWFREQAWATELSLSF